MNPERDLRASGNEGGIRNLETTDVKTEKTFASLKATLVLLDRSWILYLFQKTLITMPKKRTVQPGDALEDTVFKPRFEIVTF
jgi:hypothetical protein